MKILQQLGHNAKWNLDAHFEDGVGDGFMICARSFTPDTLREGLSNYEPTQYLSKSCIDLQYYAAGKSNSGKLDQYEFHPASKGGDNIVTLSSSTASYFDALRFQTDQLGLEKLIVPLAYPNEGSIEKMLDTARMINAKLHEHNLWGERQQYGREFYLTVPISYSAIREAEEVEKILVALTDMKMIFDGYYVVCDSGIPTKRKIGADYLYYQNLLRIFSTLKKQGFKTIHGYANWDSLLFLSLTEIDYITIGTYENLRSFHIDRFTDDQSGGGSEGWYFSEKLLGVLKANEVKETLRHHGFLKLIQNEDNKYSDIILREGYHWNIHKPQVQKNYLVAMDKLLREIDARPKIKDRAEYMLAKIDAAKEMHAHIKNSSLLLAEESKGEHLSTWQAVIKSSLSELLAKS